MPRLNQVATELNVGLSTIVETLRKSGYEVEERLSAKITDEQYELLKKHFRGSQELRQKVSQRQAEKEREKEERKQKEEERKAQKQAERLAREEIKTEVPRVQLKTVGKIDLNPKPKPQPKPEPEPQPAPEPQPVPQPVPEPKSIEEAKPKEEPKPEPQPEPAVEPAVEPVKAEEPKKDEAFRLSPTPTLSGPKVLGTIDLSAINSSTRPAKKSKEEKRKEYEAKKQGTAPAVADHKKRTRIKVGKVDIAGEAKKIQSDPSQQQSGFGQQRGGQQRGQSGRKDKRKQPVQTQQMTDEEVARKVKETLNQLTSKKAFGSGAKYRREKRAEVRAQNLERLSAEERESKILKLTEFVTANELANMMGVPVNQVIATCMSIGMMISINQRMDAETINIVADEFGFTTEYVSASVSEAVQEEEDNEDDLQPRDPIVTIMGHVDHGKTSLLDYIRNSNVIAGEAGGITQHIGAYNVELENGRHITFLDTPGHEAFTAMRARGAQVTDIAIIIIAADDDVMPQTKEAINHAVAANVPIVFAINKVDKPAANPEKIKESLANMNFLVEDWGGKYQSQEISAKKGTGVNELLEKVLLEADMLELKANPNRKATGTIIESSLDKGRGYIATILVSNGTLGIGDNVIAGTCYGRVRDLTDERGKRIKKGVGPSRAATLLGFNGAPQAGDIFHVMETEQEAREIATKRLQLQREQSLRTSHRTTLEDLAGRINIGGVQELKLIVKGDVDGSVEALSDALIKLSTEKVVVSVIHKAVGQITESDVSLAAASEAIIIGFEVRPSAGARREAEKEGIDIRLYSIIYDAINDVQAAMEGLLKPIIKEEETATLEVRQVYRISKVGTVAGAFVASGKIHRTDKVRLIREGIVKFTGAINALKRYKDDAREVSQDLECGISLVGFNDIMEGDTIEAFREIEVKQTL